MRPRGSRAAGVRVSYFSGGEPHSGGAAPARQAAARSRLLPPLPPHRDGPPGRTLGGGPCSRRRGVTRSCFLDSLTDLWSGDEGDNRAVQMFDAMVSEAAAGAGRHARRPASHRTPADVLRPRRGDRRPRRLRAGPEGRRGARVQDGPARTCSPSSTASAASAASITPERSFKVEDTDDGMVVISRDRLTRGTRRRAARRNGGAGDPHSAPRLPDHQRAARRRWRAARVTRRPPWRSSQTTGACAWESRRCRPRTAGSATPRSGVQRGEH